MVNKMHTILLIFLVVAISGCIADPYKARIGDRDVQFRSDLNEARRISIYPDESAARSLLLDPQKLTVGVVYVSNNYSINGYYFADAWEFEFKFTKIIKERIGVAKNLVTLNITDISELETVKEENELDAIVFLEAFSNETSVRIDGDIVYVRGKDMSQQPRRKYTDLDLAVDRLLLALLSV